MFYLRSMPDPRPPALGGLVANWMTPTPVPGRWPRPPAALPAARLGEPPAGALVCVAGLVLVRQRPGTAKGVIFVTLEDETGTCNVVVWAKVYERFRRAVIAGRLLRVTGRLQREAGVVHVVAERIEDISDLLDRLLRPDFRHDGVRAGDQP
jgi:DNA polymerase III alpha subunit